MSRMSPKNKVFKYALEQYGSQPEYLWSKYPQDAILRHSDNRKWYAVIMEVSGEKLGLLDENTVTVINVKVDPVLVGSLRMEKGFFPAYHMNKENWITILLDGTVAIKRITDLLDLSFAMTEGKKDSRKNFYTTF